MQKDYDDMAEISYDIGQVHGYVCGDQLCKCLFKVNINLSLDDDLSVVWLRR